MPFFPSVPCSWGILFSATSFISFSALQWGLPSPLPVQTACHLLYCYKLACQTTFLCDHVPLFSAFLGYKKKNPVPAKRSLWTKISNHRDGSSSKRDSMQNLLICFPKTFCARLSLPPRFWGREAAVSVLPRVLSPHGESLKSLGFAVFLPA